MPNFVTPVDDLDLLVHELREYNKCHTPAGSPAGGQFCSKDAATGPYPDMEDRAGWDQWRERERAWSRKMEDAVSFGKISQKDAKALGWYPGGHADETGFEPLPKTLYHVSTAYNEILRSGLKTRAEIGGVHRGLGGGEDNTVSFTEDLATARTIRAAILEARRVARGEITAQQLVQMAERMPMRERIVNPQAPGQGSFARKAEGRSDPRDPYEVLGSFYAGKTWRRGQPLPENLERLLQGEKVDSYFSSDSTHPELAAVYKAHGKVGAIPVSKLPTGMRAATSWKGRDEEFTSAVIRPLTPKERQDSTFELYKRFAMAREYAGNRMDPMFFLTDPAALAKVKVADIKILKFTPRPGAHGYRVSALGEWRVRTGKTVKYAGIAESR